MLLPALMTANVWWHEILLTYGFPQRFRMGAQTVLSARNREFKSGMFWHRVLKSGASA